MPADWPRLVQQTNTILLEHSAPRTEPLQISQVEALYNLVGELDNSALECNWYFGPGRAMCQTARLFQDPEMREKTINSTADRVLAGVSNLKSAKQGKLRIRDIGDLRFFAPFRSVSDLSVSSIPEAEEVLTDTVREHVNDRRSAMPGLIRDYRIAQIAKRGFFASILNATMSMSASVIIQQAILTHGGEGVTKDSFVRDVISDDELRNLSLDRVSIALACLRLDELRAWANGNLPGAVSTKAGQLVFDRTYLGNHRPGPVVADKGGYLPISREERLTCPALQAGLIPIVLNLMPEIIIRTGDLIAERCSARLV